MKKRLHCFYLMLLLLLSLLSSTVSQAASPKRDDNETKTYTLNITQSDLLVGDTLTLTVDGVTDEDVSFRSENSEIVSLAPRDAGSCECTAETVGKTAIVVKIREKSVLFFKNTTMTMRCTINVTPKAVSVKFKKRQYKLTLGQKKKVAVILRPGITTEIPIYTSSNPEIAVVNQKGRIITRSKGTTIISATIQNGMTVHCRVIVKGAPKEKNRPPSNTKPPTGTQPPVSTSAPKTRSAG